MEVSFSSSGSTKNLENYLAKLEKLNLRPILERHGKAGVQALVTATPKESGIAAESWGYEVKETGKSVRIIWTNSDVENGFPVAIMLQYGYGTGTGGYVKGRDYINPAIRPIFDQIAYDVWKEVTSK